MRRMPYTHVVPIYCTPYHLHYTRRNHQSHINGYLCSTTRLAGYYYSVVSVPIGCDPISLFLLSLLSEW